MGAFTVDPDLLALPAPPRRTRALAVALLALTALFALSMVFWLASDVSYAFGASAPQDVGDLAQLVPNHAQQNAFVTAQASLDTNRSLTYGRTTERDTFELRPVLGNDRLWVEMRISADVPPLAQTASNAPRSAPPRVFVGRLVPLQSAVFLYRGLGRSNVASSSALSPDAWVLIDGATPAGYRWTVGLALMLVVFAGYSLSTIVRVVRPIQR